METKTLYWGKNQVHEFWESEDHELLLLRNYPERHWTAHQNRGFLFVSDSAESAARRLKVVLSPDRVWKADGGIDSTFSPLAGHRNESPVTNVGDRKLSLPPSPECAVFARCGNRNSGRYHDISTCAIRAGECQPPPCCRHCLRRSSRSGEPNLCGFGSRRRKTLGFNWPGFAHLAALQRSEKGQK